MDLQHLDIDLPEPLNLNDAGSVERCMAYIAQKMAASKDAQAKATGLWLKYEASTFAAALADFKRQDHGVGTAIGAAVTSFAIMLSFMVGAASRKGTMGEAVKSVAEVFISTFANMCLANEKNAVPSEEALAEAKASKTVH